MRLRTAKKKYLFVILLICFFNTSYFFVENPADARVGGGHSYGGSGNRGGGSGSGSRGGGSSSGRSRGGGGHSYEGSPSSGGDYRYNYGSSYDSSDSGLIFSLVRLFFLFHAKSPFIAIPLDIFLLYLIYQMLKGHTERNVSYRPQEIPRETYKRFKETLDPNFSRTVFLDFVDFLFTTFHELRCTSKLLNLATHIDKRLLDSASAESQQCSEISRIVIGSTQIHSTGFTTDFVHLKVDFSAQYQEIKRDKTSVTYYTTEQWIFSRKKGVISKKPEDRMLLTCPACGSARERNPDGSCKECGTLMKDGHLDWFVTSIKILSREPRDFITLEHVEESGTDHPTVVDPSVYKNKEYLENINAHFSERAQEIFFKIQNAWSSLTWEAARPFETDNLFQVHKFWIEEYKRRNIRNVLDQIKFIYLEYADVELDAFYENITVRIYASMLDYSINSSTRKVLSGDNYKERMFSEYWTFIRKRGLQAEPSSNSTCPNCGAPLKISMAGVCEYCKSKITSGNFDWILSRIEQDDDY